MHKCWKWCCLWALTQAILHIIVPSHLESDVSYVKLIVVEFLKFKKPHNMKSKTGYVPSITCSVSGFLFISILFFLESMMWRHMAATL